MRGTDAVDTKGNPYWQNSLAQQLLRADIEDNKHKQMRPRLLYETRVAFHETYSLDFFRDRIYQEVKAKKHRIYTKEQCEKKKAEEKAKNEKKAKAKEKNNKL